MAKATLPAWRFVALPLRRPWYRLKRYVWYATIVGPLGSAKTIFHELLSPRLGKQASQGRLGTHTTARSGDVLNLQPGDWVKVRSAKEIFGTLEFYAYSPEGKKEDLSFTREMTKFCGKEFRVYKRLGRMLMGGEMRTISAPAVLLEGAFCDGESHGGCTRSCFCFWREAWLEKVTHDPTLVSSAV
jgi:hypothetical protein